MSEKNVKTYPSDDVDVSYNIKRCIHAKECVHRLHAVFDVSKRPWIQPENASADAIANTIEYCPTGALHYDRKDGEPNESPDDATTLKLVEDGPTYVRGDLHLMDESGEEVAVTSGSMFIRGLGGFGGERGSSDKVEIPDRAPDKVYQEQTLPTQALIYRLSGDINPLHADPSMAQLGNFDKPILHGLASYGFAGRAILKQFCDNNPALFKGMSGRFSREVYPSDTLITEMWDDEDGVIFQTRVLERDVVVLSNGKALLS